MNIIVAFTSPNIPEYTDTWRCLTKQRNNCGKEWANEESKLFVFNGKMNECTTYYDSNGWKPGALAKEIKEIANKKKNAKIVVLLHTQDQNDVKRLANELDSPNIPINKYSSVGNGDIWESHISQFCNEANTTLEEKFISLWNDLQKKSKESDLHNLRYEILSPLVSLDLIQQAEGNNTLDENDNLTELKGNIRAAIDALEEPIEEFCKVPIKCDEFEERLRELMKPEHHSSWENYHKDLKDVAEQMETQVAAIEP